MLDLVQSFFNNSYQSILINIVCLLIGSIATLVFYRLKYSKEKLNDENRSRKLFSKIGSVVLFFIMALFLLFSFFGHKQGFSISNGIVYILGLMIFLLLSDSIETFAIGNLVTLSKKVKNKEKENEKLSTENSQLRAQIVSIATASITNNNHNQIIVDLSNALRGVNVESAVKDDCEEDDAKEAEPVSPANANQSRFGMSGYDRNRFFRIVEKKIIEKFAIKNDIDINSIQMNVKFSEQFTYGNPIMESKLVYDAYLKRPLDELFIDSIQLSSSIMVNYRLYYMISMVVHYAQSNNRAAKLILLIPNYPAAWAEKVFPHRNQLKDIERLQNTFQPAIKNGFLEIKVMEFSEAECQEIEKTMQQEKTV